MRERLIAARPLDPVGKRADGSVLLVLGWSGSATAQTWVVGRDRVPGHGRLDGLHDAAGARTNCAARRA